MNFHARPAQDVMSEAREFYLRTGRDTSIDPSDTLVYAEENGEWMGVVRLCREHSHYLLRTMQVKPGAQGKMIGSQILKQFSLLAAEMDIREMHLIAFDYLEGFYGQIGFKKTDTAPGFLMERLAAVARKSPEKKHILMHWHLPAR